VFLVVESLSRHNGLWAESVRNSSFGWEKNEHLDRIVHNVHHQELWDMLEWLVSCDEQLGSVP
jgi:hypothetical protein